tara:strand:+ start:124 stop:312 length:189 start_codon:yes stop_codon:yes gene_type:complete
MLTAATAMPAMATQRLSISTDTPTIAAAAAAQLEGSIDRLVIHFIIVFMLVFLLLLEIYNEK